MKTLAVVGAGWAGLAAAVAATQAGHRVAVFEMARAAGGRARSIVQGGEALDNGQHILIGAYRQTLELMRTVGVDPARVLQRLPLALVDGQGRGLRLPTGHPVMAFVRGVLAHRGWALRDRLALLWRAARWRAQGFDCDPQWSVAELVRGLPQAPVRELIEPLCIAALNTPARQASARVMLKVLADGLFGGPGASDLLLPRVPLGQLLPEAALAWLAARGARVELGHRCQVIDAVPGGVGWRLDGERFDRVIVAVSSAEAMRLVGPFDAGWLARARGMRHEAIVTLTADVPGAVLLAPMLALSGAPAQFAFDQGQLSGHAGRIALVASGANAWLERGRGAIEAAMLAQAVAQIPGWPAQNASVRATTIERRATFACTPALQRPPARIQPGLAVAGDYVEGPYPATLEGAVRSGQAAVATAAMQS